MLRARHLVRLVIFCIGVATAIAAAQELSQPVEIARPASEKPLVRIDSNVRGSASGLPEVISMTPGRYNARTLSDRPTLYWYLSKDTKGAVRVTLRETGARSAKPVFECEVAGPIAAGVHTVKLADHGVALQNTREYSWFVRLQNPDAKEPVASTSFIEFGDLASAAALRNELAGATPQQRYRRLAARYWYDALATIIGLVTEAPLSRDYRNRYAELLRDGQLDDVAAHIMTTPQIVPSTCAPTRKP